MRAHAFFFVVLTAATTAHAQKKYSFTRSEMGSPFTITIATGSGARATSADSLAAAKAASTAFHLADSLNGILSDYVDSSEINKLSATSGQVGARRCICFNAPQSKD